MKKLGKIKFTVDIHFGEKAQECWLTYGTATPKRMLTKSPPTHHVEECTNNNHFITTTIDYHPTRPSITVTHSIYEGETTQPTFFFGTYRMCLGKSLFSMKKFNTEALLKTHEITEEHYENMLGVLPPERQCGNAFLVGEATDYDKDHSGHFRARYQLFFEDGGKFYDGGLCSVSDFDAFVLPDGRTDDEKDGTELAEDRKCVRCTEALEQNDDLLCGACSYQDAIY